jgi:SAM-dependent methyltransferase
VSAAGWEAEREGVAAFMAPVTDALLAALEPRRDDVVLELAAGTGDVAAALAGRVARVVATDLSPAMVDAARRRELPGVEHRVVDMQALDLEDASVDAVVCRCGYMLVPDPARALRETRRVLRPGGRLAFATWAPASRNPGATAFEPVLLARGLAEPPRPGEPGQFALGEPDAIEALVRGAGFGEATVLEVPVEARYASWDDYRRTMTSLASSVRETLAGLDEAIRAEVDEAARARVEPYRAGDGYVLPGVALVTSAR